VITAARYALLAAVLAALTVPGISAATGQSLPWMLAGGVGCGVAAALILGARQ
jgi:hypothetical protein